MTADIDAMSDLVTDGLVTLVTGLITVVGVAVILIFMDWQLALATLVVAPLIALAARIWRRWSADAYRQVRETYSVVNVQLQESLSGVRAIQAFRRERATAGRLAEANQDERVAHWRTISLSSFFFPGIEFLGTAATVVVLGVGGQRVLTGDLDIGVLAAFLLYLRSLFDLVQQLSELYDSFQSATAGAERVGAARRVPSVREARDPVPPPPPPRRGPAGGRQLRVRPGSGGAARRGPPARRRDDPGPDRADRGGQVDRGQAHRPLLRPRGGRVTLDGVDLRQIRLTDLRRAMGYVPQEGFLFSGTVLDNIRFGRPDATGLRSRRPPARSGPTRSSPACPTATTPRSASGARCWRPASASWSPSPGPGSPTRPC